MYTTIISLHYRKSSYIKRKKVFQEGDKVLHSVLRMCIKTSSTCDIKPEIIRVVFVEQKKAVIIRL